MNQYNIPAIAGRICHLRKQKGLSLEEASEMLGIQRRSLSHIEAGVKGFEDYVLILCSFIVKAGVCQTFCFYFSISLLKILVAVLAFAPRPLR